MPPHRVLAAPSSLVLLVVLLAAAAPPLRRPRRPGPGRRLAARPPARGRPRLRPADDPWGAGHRGVDLLGSPGQPVRAALPGTVASPGCSPGAASSWSTTGPPAPPTSRSPRPSRSAHPVAAGAPGRDPRARRVALLPARLPALGLDRGRRPTSTRCASSGGGPVRLLPLWRREPRGQALRRRRRRLDAGDRSSAAVALRRGGAPAGRPAAAGRW